MTHPVSRSRSQSQSRSGAKAAAPAPAAQGPALMRLALVSAGLVVLALIWQSAAWARATPESFADLVEKLSPAVVNISSESYVETGRRGVVPPGFERFQDELERFFGRPRGEDEDEGEVEERPVRSLGSGFIIDPDGYIVTNFHVIKGAEDVRVTLPNNKELRAEVIGGDEATDLALIKVESEEPLPHVTFGDSDAMRVGDWVLAIGNPFGLSNTVTAGILSAEGRVLGGPEQVGEYFQTDAPINRGNSGGPMFNLDGDVIGVNTAIFSPSGGNVGIGFAIPSNFAMKVLSDLREYGRFRRAWIGVAITPLDPLTKDALGLDVAGGAMVQEITPGSPAADAGLRPGDVIVSFDGQQVLSSSELAQIAATAGVGKSVKVEFFRDGKRRRLDLTLGEFPENAQIASRDSAPTPDPRGEEPATEEVLGMRVAPLTDPLRERFDLPTDLNGTVVLEVEPRSEAARGNRLQAGDVIVEVNQEPVDRPAAIEQGIERARSRDRGAVLFYVYRRGTYFHVPLPIGQG